MNSGSISHIRDLDKNLVFNGRFYVLEWLLNTTHAKLYIGKALQLLANVIGMDQLTKEHILIKIVHFTQKLVMV
jgi:hypothetical protein